MQLNEFFPMWDKLSQNERETLVNSAKKITYKKGDIIYSGGGECTGLVLVNSGQLRAFAMSEDGREITVYRLFERDICIFTASCMLSSIRFEMAIKAEKDSEVYVIPTETYRSLVNKSTALSNFNTELVASNLSDVMWLVDQIMWKSFDKRLAAFLLEESALNNTTTLKITHEEIANHLGTAREVVTRMLKYFALEGMVALSRGSIEITDLKKLNEVN